MNIVMYIIKIFLIKSPPSILLSVKVTDIYTETHVFKHYYKKIYTFILFSSMIGLVRFKRNLIQKKHLIIIIKEFFGGKESSF